MVKPEPAPALTIDVPPRSEIVIALAQLAPRLGDLAANVTRHLELIGTAAAEGADLVVFPELSLTGYFLKDLVTETALRLDSPEIQLLAEASRGVDAVVGCILESDGHRFHNAALRSHSRHEKRNRRRYSADLFHLLRAGSSNNQHAVTGRIPFRTYS